jgi:hypothetical protein
MANGAICAICEEWNDLQALREMRDLQGQLIGDMLINSLFKPYEKVVRGKPCLSA